MLVGKGNIGFCGLLLGLVGGWAVQAHADDELVLALGEQDFFTELPVVLTASRLPQQQADLPAAITVIDRAMIDASGVSDIPSLFRLVAGFQVGHDRDQRVTVTYHGASDQFARRMQVLVDGRSIYTPATGGVDWVDLPVSLEDIARIEVTRGPNGVTYGANAFLGVINIITFHPGDVRGFTFKTAIGEDKYRKGTLRYAGNTGDLDYRLTVERREDTGVNDLNWDGGTPKSAHDDQRTTVLTLRADYLATINDQLTFQLGKSQGPRERGFGPTKDSPQRWQQSHGDYQQLQWKHLHSSTEEFKLQFYRHYQLHRDDLQINLPPLLAFDQSIETERYNLELEHLYAPASDWRLAWGAEARLDYSKAPGYFKSSDFYKNHLYRLFANGEWRPHAQWTVNMGLLFEHNELAKEDFSPRLALNYRLDDQYYLRGSYSEAYRTPAVFEEYANAAVRLYSSDAIYDQLYYSAGNLKPEHISSYELGFGRRTTGSRLSYEIKLYREEISDVIAAYYDYARDSTSIAQDGTYKFTNNGNTTITGIEIQARAQPTASSLISLAYAYAQVKGSVLAKESPIGYKDMSKTTPRHTFSVLLASDLSARWRGSLGLYHVTNFEWGGGSENIHYTTADATLRRSFKTDELSGNLFLTVRDMLAAYYDYRNDIFLEKRVHLGVELHIP